jgi:hypothetical protein
VMPAQNAIGAGDADADREIPQDHLVFGLP